MILDWLFYLHFLTALKGTPAPGVEVFKVIDGDTVVLTDGNRGRLRDIDAPEMSQPYGEESKLYLGSLVRRHDVSILKIKKDFYKRDLIDIYSGDECINKTMVVDGYAWAYNNKYRDQQLAAQVYRRGLWVLDNPENPKDYRKRVKRDRVKRERKKSLIRSR